MTDNAGARLIDEADVIHLLRSTLKVDAPPMPDLIDRVLASGRRARRRRRALIVPASGLALAGLTALAFAISSAQKVDRPLALSPASPSASATDAREQTRINEQVLQEALGPDFVVDSEGNRTVRAGSPSAEGLPSGLEDVTTQILTIQQSPTSGDLSQFCKPMVEKNVIFSACSSRIVADGQTVHVRQSRSGTGGARLGNGDRIAGDGVRILFEQRDGTLVIVDLSTKELESNSTPERRAAAQAWLDRMIPRLVNAATDPRVSDPDPARSIAERKPSDASST